MKSFRRVNSLDDVSLRFSYRNVASKSQSGEITDVIVEWNVRREGLSMRKKEKRLETIGKTKEKSRVWRMEEVRRTLHNPLYFGPSYTNPPRGKRSFRRLSYSKNGTEFVYCKKMLILKGKWDEVRLNTHMKETENNLRIYWMARETHLLSIEGREEWRWRRWRSGLIERI